MHRRCKLLFIVAALLSFFAVARGENPGKESRTFWSLQPLRKPELPACSNQRWAANPIDHFVLAELEKHGMKPSPALDRKSLLRRVTYDLTGLPPTTAETEIFLNDHSPNAFERVVDRLLASPRYGERWARHWLDVVHYADSHGHSQDRVRTNAWPYRDYVIRSFNEDKPYSRFVQEQLAGDVLFPKDPQGIVALGFIAAGPWDDSTQVFITEDSFDKRQAQNLDRDDMVSTAMSTFASTTVHCARCHDHKFDPISQREYYALQAVFAGIDRIDRPYDEDSTTNLRRQTLLKRKTALDVSLKGDALLEPGIQAEVAKWEKALGVNRVEWTVLDAIEAKSDGGVHLSPQPDHSIVASGERPETATYTITAATDLHYISAIRLEALADENLPMKGPGRADNGNFALSEFRVSIASLANPEATSKVVLQNATADYNERFNGVDYDVTKTLDNDPKTSWGIYPETGKSHFAFFELKQAQDLSGKSRLTFVLEQKYKQHLLGRIRLSVTSARLPVRVPSIPEAISKTLQIPGSSRTKDQKIELAAYYLKTQVDTELSRLPEPKMVYAVANDFEPRKIFKPAKSPRPIHVLKRGDINRPLDEVAPGALSLVPDLPAEFKLSDPIDESGRRAALARWLTAPENVLTWRAIVNRIWQYHFGRGIVDSPNDFGRMGGRPSHPELLDWLATQFMESAGSFKALHRLILCSSAYQQSSQDNPAYSGIDSDNRLLWRMNRMRLDAEEVRDSILQFSGKLDLRMGGPADMEFKLDDPNPPVTPIVDYAAFNIDSPASFRRGIYRFIFRTIPDPFMDALDCPDGSQLTPARTVSFTALQALAMWNDRFVLLQSKELALKLAAKHPKIDDQVRALYQVVLGRPPRRDELKEINAFARDHGLAETCRVILNCNEFMFVD